MSVPMEKGVAQSIPLQYENPFEELAIWPRNFVYVLETRDFNFMQFIHLFLIRPAR